MDKPKVYVVVPNTGNMRVGLAKLMFEIVLDNRFQVTWADPDKTNREPGSHNRNMCVKEFLETDNEWFVTIDSDVVPSYNPLTFITANKDIIGMPTRIVHGSRIIWNVFKWNEDLTRYLFITTPFRELSADLIECDAIGAGCLIIRREVLENVEAPFMRKWTEEGLQDTGHDLAFCQKAQEAGYKILFSPNAICEHYKVVPLEDTRWHNQMFEIDEAIQKNFLQEKPEKKLYVVGSGRCGTYTVSSMMKGLHEPYPHILRDVHFRWLGDNRFEGELIKKLKLRASYTVPCISDHAQSYVIPLIRYVDPTAEFLVLIREPYAFVRSAVNREWYKQADEHPNDYEHFLDRWRIEPRDGWPEGFTYPLRNMWLWVQTYKTIFRDLKGFTDYEVEFTHNIPYKVINKSSKVEEIVFTDEEQKYFDTHVLPYWEQLKEEYDTNG